MRDPEGHGNERAEANADGLRLDGQ